MSISIGKVVALIKSLTTELGDVTVGNLMVQEATEYLADGNTVQNQEGNYKIDIVNNQFKILEYINGVWVEVTTFGSVISDYFKLDERYSTIDFKDPRYPDIEKNIARMTTSTDDDSIDLGDSRLEGIYLSGTNLYHTKLRLINNDVEQSTNLIDTQPISNTEQEVSQIAFTVTAQNNDIENQTANLIYSTLFDIKEDCKANLKVYRHGETTNPLYQTVKDSELNKGLGFPINANSTEQKLLRMLYFKPNEQYDIYIDFESPTLVGGYIDAFAQFQPKIGYRNVLCDDIEIYDMDNLKAEDIRDMLHSLENENRLKSSALYNKVHETSGTITINEIDRNDYVNSLVICDNTSGQINVVISENVFNIGDKLTIKQSTNIAGSPTCRFVPFNGTIDGESSITIYTGQSATVQCVAPNVFVTISKNNNVDDIFVDMQDPTGFVDSNSVSLSFDNSLRRLSISPIGAFYEYYVKGLKQKIDSIKTIDIPDVEGKYYFYLDANQELNYITSFNMNTLFYDNAYVAVVHWSVSGQKQIYFGKETHGINMQGKVHEYLHTNFGARYKSGLGFHTFQIDGDGTSDYDAKFQYDSGVIYDEDIQHNINASNNFAEIPIYYREGTTAINRKEADTFPLIGKNDITVTARPKYNQNIGGNWQLTEVGVNDYWLVHYFATNDINYPIIGWTGNNVYENAIQARDGAYNEINTLSGLPFEEFCPIASVIFKTDSFANEPNAIIVSTDDGGNYIDFRGVATVEGVTNVAEHGSLVGNNLPNAHPALAIDVDTTNLDGNLNGVGSTSQELFDAIDDLSIEEKFSEIRIIDTGLPKEVRTARQLEGSYSMRLHMRNIDDFDTLNLELNGLQIASGIPKVEGYSTFDYTISEAQSTSGTNLFVAELPIEITTVTGNPQIYNGSVLQKYTTAKLESDGRPFGFDFKFLDLYHSVERVEELLGTHFCQLNLLNNVDLIENINIQFTIGSISRTLTHNMTNFSVGSNLFQVTITQENVDAFLSQIQNDDMISITLSISGNGSNINLNAGNIYIEEYDNKNRHIVYNVSKIDTDTDTIIELETNYPVTTLPEYGELIAFNNAQILDNLGAFGISDRFNLDNSQGALILLENDGSDSYVFRLITPYYNELKVISQEDDKVYKHDTNQWIDGLNVVWGKIIGTLTNQSDITNYIQTELDNLFESSENVGTYENNDFIYTVVGVDNAWYADRMSKTDPFEETRHPEIGESSAIKPTTLLEVQALAYA